MAGAASAWAAEAERLRARLGAPSPAPSARAEGTAGRPASAAGHSGHAETDAAASSGAHAPWQSNALPSPHHGGASAIAAWNAAAGGGPPPLSGLLKGLQILSDAGAGSTPLGTAAIADATTEARRGCVSLGASHALRAAAAARRSRSCEPSARATRLEKSLFAAAL